MRRYSRVELVAFLKGIDGLLDQPTDLLIIGGAAATLRYGATQATRDIDTWSNIPPAILQAAEEARTVTRLAIPMERASVADAPYHHEDRIVHAPLGLKKLRVFVPERHDLVLMKAVRADRHDVDAIMEMHKKRPFSLETLVDRFENEMGHVIKDQRILRQQFRLLVQALFGTKGAQTIRAMRLTSRDPRV